jgi:hypothetical protein
MDGDRYEGLLGDLGGDRPPRGRRRAAGGAHGARPADGGRPQQGGHATGGSTTGGYATGDSSTGGYATGGYGTGGHGTGGHGSNGSNGSGGGGPNRRVVLTTLAVTVLVAVLAGGLWGLLRPAARTTTTLAGASATASPTGSATSTPTKTPAATATKSATPTPTPRDTEYVEDPTTVEGMDFGLLRGISRSGATVTLRFDRAQFLTGSAAAKYYAKNPDLEPLDYAIVNTNTRLRSLPVTKDAVVYAQLALGDGGSLRTQPISTDQLYERARALLGQKQTVLLWLRHTKEPDGPVYYVAEQYTP